MTSRPCILTFVGTYEPGFRAGGPIKSLAGLVDHLGKDFSFKIVTSDRDLAMERSYRGITPDRWKCRGAAEVCYLSPGRRSLVSFGKLVRETRHDLVYLNSFHARTWAIAPLVLRRLGLLRRPTLLAPRGEFSDGAQALKRGRKTIYRRFGTAFGLFDGLHWQASTSAEADDISRRFVLPVGHLHVARNLVPIDPLRFERHSRSPDQPLRILFLSRLSPKKNLDGALSILTAVRSPVQLDIVGTEEDCEYVARCRAIAATLPPHIQLRWLGPVNPGDVKRVMSEHDLLFFPTHGENFGHVIAEALATGTPLLISDQTPWRDLARHGAGHDLPLDQPAAFVEVIEQMALWSPARHEQASTAVRRLAAKLLDPAADIEANRVMFERVLAS